jgi:hypothetical protein
LEVGVATGWPARRQVRRRRARPTMAAAHYALPVMELRLTHPDLDFYVDVRVTPFEGRWLATADLALRTDPMSGQATRHARL